MERLFEDHDFLSHVSNFVDESGDGLPLKLIFKYGFDGLGGFDEYHQNPEDIVDRDVDEKSLLATQMALIRIVTSTGALVYQNPLPNSASVCRPVRLKYERETLGMITKHDYKLSEAGRSKIRSLDQNFEVLRKFIYYVFPASNKKCLTYSKWECLIYSN
jgi:hypothetical protein